MENACRVCARSNISLMDIFSKLDPSGPSPAEMLLNCVDRNLHQDDPFPKKICLVCVVATQKAYKLNQKYEQSQQHFSQLLDINNISVSLLYPECEQDSSREIKREAEEEVEATATATAAATATAEEPIDNIKIEEEECRLQEDADLDSSYMAYEFIANDQELKINRINSFMKGLTHFCDTCSQGFPNNRKLILHSLKHFNFEKHQCPYCGKVYQSRSGLYQHVVFHSGEKPHQCPHCPEAFVHKETLRRHVLNHADEPTFFCPKCDMSFVKSSQLDYHMRSHNLKTYQCGICPKKLRTRDLLRKHMRIHSISRPFQCPQCPNRFFKTVQLQNHIATHLNERRFKCKGCARTFNAIGELHHHERFKCEVPKSSELETSHPIRTRLNTRVEVITETDE